MKIGKKASGIFFIFEFILFIKIDSLCITPQMIATTPFISTTVQSPYNYQVQVVRNLGGNFTATTKIIASPKVTIFNFGLSCEIRNNYRLNSTAIDQLSLIESFNSKNKNDCCFACNTDPGCHYAFESSNNHGDAICTTYHWNVPEGMFIHDLWNEIKDGKWIEKTSGNSGTLIFATKFFNSIRFEN